MPAHGIEFDQREIIAVIQYASDHGFIDMNGNLCVPPTNSDLTQLLKAIFGIVRSVSKQLVQNVNYYVDAAIGSDTYYDGTSPSVIAGTTHGPFLTIQQAVNVVSQFGPSVYGATITIAKGVYAGFTTPTYAFCRLNIVGESMSGPAQTLINGNYDFALVGLNGPNSFNISNLAISNTSSFANSTCLTSGYGAVTTVNNVEFYPASPNSVFLEAFSAALYVQNITLNGSCGSVFISTGAGGSVDLSKAVVSIPSAITVVNFVVAYDLGLLGVSSNGNTCQFINPGNVTGQRYSVQYNAVINAGGFGSNFFPGTIAGAASLGGQYG